MAMAAWSANAWQRRISTGVNTRSCSSSSNSTRPMTRSPMVRGSMSRLRVSCRRIRATSAGSASGSVTWIATGWRLSSTVRVLGKSSTAYRVPGGSAYSGHRWRHSSQVTSISASLSQREMVQPATSVTFNICSAMMANICSRSSVDEIALLASSKVDSSTARRLRSVISAKAASTLASLPFEKSGRALARTGTARPCLFSRVVS